MDAKSKPVNGKVEEILSSYRHEEGMLVSILQDVQKAYNYLPKEALIQVSHGLKVPLTQVYSVATFFRAFALTPRGRHIINVCLGTACHVRGGIRVVERLEQELGIKRGETTQDLKFTLETVNCVGACALGPNVIIDGEYSGQMTMGKVKPLIAKYN